MILTGDYLRPQINFEPFWEKPPLFIWMQVVSMKLFGINEYAARFPNAVCGLVSLLALYGIGKRLFNERFGMWWVLAYLGSILPHLYLRSGIIDPWLNLFIFSGLYQLPALPRTERQRRPLADRFLGHLHRVGRIDQGPRGVCCFSVFAASLVYLHAFGRGIVLGRGLVCVGLYGYRGHMVRHGQRASANGTWFVTEFITYQIRLFQTKDAVTAVFPGYHAWWYCCLLFPCLGSAARSVYLAEPPRAKPRPAIFG